MTTTVYKVYLRGIGEEEIRFLSEDAFRWILNPDPGIPPGQESASSWDDQACPPSVRRAILDEEEETFADDEERGVYITSGSWQNDRAILSPVVTIDGEMGYFFDDDEANYFIESHNLTVADTYEGILY